MSGSRPPPGSAAASPRGAHLLRGLPADLLSRECGVLKIVAFVDGASRGNPGPSGYGAYLTTDGGETIEAFGFLGVTTNNIAEYRGLLEAMEIALAEGALELDVLSDSQLLVNQLNGSYRVRHPNIVPLHQRAVELKRQFVRFSVRHTPRAGNRDADRLANLAIDRGELRHVERRRTDG